MLKKIGKMCISLIVALLLALAVWYFLLIKLPEDVLVQGSGSPNISKEEILSLMDYHSVKVIRIKEGRWIFERDGKICKLSRRK